MPAKMPVSHKNIPVTGQNPLVSQTIRQASLDTHNFLGDSGIKVSKVCLGTMTFGNIDKTFGERPGQLNEHEAHRILDRFVELGGNFIDTGAFYPFFGKTAGESERIIGNWLVNQDRKNLVISTCAGLPTNMENPNAIGLSRINLLNELELSLKRLKTSYVDLFCVAGWDETTNLGDVMRTLNDFVRNGRVRHIGVCDLKAWQLQACLDYAKVFNMEKCMSISCEYNLLSRGADLEIVDVCRSRRVSLLAYSPLKGGYLTDKIKPGMTKAPSNTRIEAASASQNNVAALAVPLEDMRNNQLFNRVQNTCQTIARKHGKTIAQVALRYLLHKDFICSVIIGCKSISQLEENMGCLSFTLNQEDVEELDRVSLPQLQLPAPYNVNEFLKLTRSRLQLHNNLFSIGSLTGSMVGGSNVLSQPIQMLTEPSLVSVPPNIASGLELMSGQQHQHQHQHQIDEKGPHGRQQQQQQHQKGSKADEISHRHQQQQQDRDVGEVRGRMDNLRVSEKDGSRESEEHGRQQQQKGGRQQQQDGRQQQQQQHDGTSSHGIGSTLGSIAHTIGSSLTSAMSGGGLSGTSVDGTRGSNVQQDTRRNPNVRD